MKAFLIAAAMTVATSAHAESPHQFDLVCSGVEHDIGYRTVDGMEPDKDQPMAFTMAVDVDARAASGGKTNYPIEINPEAITEHNPAATTVIYRANGHFRITRSHTKDWSEGDCKVAPFTGMAKTAF